MNNKNNVLSYLKNTLIYILLCVLVLIIALSLSAYLINNEILQMSSMRFIIPIVYFIIGCLGSAFKNSGNTRNQLKNSAIRFVLICITVALSTLIAYRGNILIRPMYLLMYIIGVFIPMLVQNRIRIGGKKIRYKYKNS